VQSGKVVVMVTVNEMQNMLEYVALQTGSDQTTFSFVGSVSCAPTLLSLVCVGTAVLSKG